MSTQDHELERMLGRDLHDQVDGLTGVPFGFHDVKGRAGRIRRNRRISAAVGVAAALAVIVPMSITARGMVQLKDEIQPASPDAPVEVPRTRLTLDGLDRGDAPAIEYFTPGGVVLPGEGTQPLPENYQALVRSEAQGGWIALGPAADEVLYLSGDFEPQGGSASGNGFATTPQGDYVAWTVPEPVAQTLGVHSTTHPDQAMFWDFPELPVVEPVGILGSDSVVYETRTPRGVATVGLAYPDGTTTELPYLGAVAADPINGLISVQTEVRENTGCFAVVEAATLQAAWDTCDYKLGTFSPDGRYVMATAAESDAAGPSMLYVLDARTGALVAEFSSQGQMLVNLIGPAWESASSIIASASEGNTQTLIRMGVDGTLEEVADPVAGSVYDDVYYVLGENRAGL